MTKHEASGVLSKDQEIIDSLERENAQLRKECDQLDDERDDLRVQIAEMTNTSNRIAIQNAHLRERIKALEAWVESLGGVVVRDEVK